MYISGMAFRAIVHEMHNKQSQNSIYYIPLEKQGQTVDFSLQGLREATPLN